MCSQTLLIQFTMSPVWENHQRFIQNLNGDTGLSIEMAAGDRAEA